MYKRVENSSDLIRDERTGAVIDINVKKLREAKKAKRNRLQRIEEQNQMKSEIQELKDSMVEIKSVLNKIVEKL
jgi:hypothetical protein